MADVESKLYEIIAEQVPGAAARLKREASLEELEIGSLEFVEIVFDLEEAFDISIDFNANEELSAFNTLGDIIVAVEALVAAKPEA